MSNQAPPEGTSTDEKENVRAGYQAAVNLWVYEGTTIWAKFTGMVYANTILLATLGLVITSNRAAELAKLRIAIAVLGLSLCAAWFLLTKRSFEFYKYWIFSARELENHLPPVQTISRGGTFADGGKITVNTIPAKVFELGGITKLKIEHVSYFVVAVFAIVYVLTLFQV